MSTPHAISKHPTPPSCMHHTDVYCARQTQPRLLSLVALEKKHTHKTHKDKDEHKVHGTIVFRVHLAFSEALSSLSMVEELYTIIIVVPHPKP